MKNFDDIAVNMQYRTALLESLDWDDSRLIQLLDYLETEFNTFELKHPANIVNFVSENFSINTGIVLERMFKTQMIYNNMHRSDHNEEN